MSTLNRALKEIESKPVIELTPLDIVILGETNESMQMAAADQSARLQAENAEMREALNKIMLLYRVYIPYPSRSDSPSRSAKREMFLDGQVAEASSLATRVLEKYPREEKG